MNIIKRFLSRAAAAKSFGVSRAILLGAGFFLGGSAPVNATLYQWSFSNVVGGLSGTVGGTLEVGEGTEVAASSVILTSSTNPAFTSLIGLDFAGLPNFSNKFNVVGGSILAAAFANDWFAGSVANISLELNSNVFGDNNSQNLGLLTTAGNPLTGGVCTAGCLQTANVSADNTGQTQFAPVFTAQVPEPGPLALLSAGLIPLYRRARN
jgi:hypothetical protein